MTTYYVKQSGNDSLSGTSKANAFATFTKAHDVAVGGDTIVIVGTINQICSVTKNFSSGAQLTVIPDPTDGGLIDGEFTKPSGGGGLENPNTGDLSLYKGLITLSGSYIIWKVDVINSQGRGISGSGHHITLQDCTIDWSRNAGVNFNGGNDITCTNVLVYHSGCFYQASRNPSVTNWPVAFNFVNVQGITATNCISALNWGEGFAVGRMSVGATVTGCAFVENMSTNFYVNRGQDALILRCVSYHTGTLFPGRSRGFTVQNESNPSLMENNAKNIVFAHCVAWGNKRNFAIGSGQGTGDAPENVAFLFCTSINSVAAPGESDNFAFFWSNNGYSNILIKKCLIYEESGRYVSAGGGTTGMTFTQNAWGGHASLPPASIRSGSDMYGVSLSNPNGIFSNTSYTLDNYRPTQAYVVGAETAPAYTYGGSIGTTDAGGSARSIYTVGALEFGGGAPPPPPGSTYSIAHFQFAMPTTTGSVEYALTGLTDTPNLLRAYAGITTANGSAVDGAVLSEGAASGDGQFAIAQRVEHGSAAEDSTRTTVSDAFILLLNSATGAIIAKGAYVSATTTTLTINWLIAPSSAYLFVVEALTLPNVYVGVASINATQDAYTTVVPNFEPDIVEVYTTGRSIPQPSGNQSWIHSAGIARWNGSTITQYGLITLHLSGADPTEASAQMLTNRIGALIVANGNITWSLEVSTITGTDFRVYTRGGALGTSASMGVIAYALGGRASELRMDTTPSAGVSSPENATLTGLSFKPGYIRRLQSLLQATDTPITTGDAGARGVSSMLAASQYNIAWAGEDDAATSNTQTLTTNTALNVPLHTGAAGIVATLSAFTSDGRTLNYTASPAGSRYAIELLIEEAEPTPTSSLDAEFDVTPTSGDSPLEVAVDASTSVAIDTTITTWTWDWGDGSAPEEFEIDTASHTYTVAEVDSPATFIIGLTVSDGTISDYQASEAITVTYIPPPPPAEPEAVLLSAIGGSDHPIEPLGTPFAG